VDWKNQEQSLLVHLGKLPIPLLYSLSICPCSEMPISHMADGQKSAKDRRERWGIIRGRRG
jgi:hypothetical protein